MAVAAVVAVDVLVVREVIGVGGGGVVVVVVAVLAVAVVVDVAAAAAVVEVAAAVVGGGWRGCIEAGWGGGTRGEIVEVEVVGVGGPTFEVGEDSRMETFAGRDQNRKRRWRSDVVVGQDAWMVERRYGREIVREGVDGVVVVVAGAGKLAVGSSFGRLDVEA